MLDGPGNSSTSDRIALMDRYLAIFGASSVKVLLADREFIGLAWLNYLVENNIAFVIRIKANMIVMTEDGRQMQLSRLLRTVRGSRRARIGLQRQKALEPLWLDCAAKRIKRRTAYRTDQQGPPSRPQQLPQALEHRIHVRRCQDSGLEPGGYAADHYA